ncbi:MAG: Rieske 2Fe-2S domain-containing protein [Chitinophagaceae bacterium]
MIEEKVWYSGPNTGSLEEGKIVEVLLGEKTLCLLKRGEKILAFSALCPHASGRLCEGKIDSRGNVVCPVHQYRFNPANGYNSSGEGYHLKTFPVKLEDGLIFVQF